MLDEAGRLDVVAVVQHEFDVLRRRGDVLAELLRAHRAIDQRHRHRLALGVAEHQAVAAGELRRRGLRALELVDHLAFGQRRARRCRWRSRVPAARSPSPTSPMRISPANGMRAAIAALRRVAHRQQEPLVAARQGLQAARRGRRGKPAARASGRRARIRRRAVRLDQPLLPQDRPARAASRRRLRVASRRRRRGGRLLPARNRAAGACSRRSGRAPARPADP